MSATSCKCGRELGRAEVRVVQRCAGGHFVASAIAPAVLGVGSVYATPGQIRAFHAKCTAIDQAAGDAIGTRKQRAKSEAGWTSTTQIPADQMTALLDQLEVELR